MGKIKKEFFTIGFGLLFAVFILLFKLFVFSEKKISVEDVALDESVLISYSVTDKTENLLVSSLELFAFSTDSIGTATSDESLLSVLENLSVRIVAQANVAGVQYTLIEIISPTKSKRLLVKEGSIVGDVLVKKISKQHIVIESNGVEYVIKLFHPKKLNLTNIE